MRASSQRQDVEHLAETIAKHGLDEGIDAAARWHSNNSTTDPITAEELLRRVKCLNPDHIDQYHQDLPNALALRLLAPRPGQSFGFEDKSTIKADGKPQYNYKCKAPSCTFEGQDKNRHMDGQHVRDIDGALCCPYEKCEHIFYKSRVSEFETHCRWHQGKKHKMRSWKN